MTFITLEGPEGAGKSTQAEALAEAIRTAGRTVLLTREPGGAPEAEELRRLLLDENKDWSPLAETLLMNAARDAHLRRTILPALARGETVICDRFCDSTEAYQIGAEEEVVSTLRKAVVQRMPALTLLFDLPVEVGLSRAEKRGAADRFERRGLDYHRAVRERFLAIAAREPMRVVRIDANQKPQEVEKEVLAAVNARLPGLL